MRMQSRPSTQNVATASENRSGAGHLGGERRAKKQTQVHRHVDRGVAVRERHMSFQAAWKERRDSLGGKKMRRS